MIFWNSELIPRIEKIFFSLIFCSFVDKNDDFLFVYYPCGQVTNIIILPASKSSLETILSIFIIICTFKFNTYPPSFCQEPFVTDSLFCCVSATIET